MADTTTGGKVSYGTMSDPQQPQPQAPPYSQEPPNYQQGAYPPQGQGQPAPYYQDQQTTTVIMQQPLLAHTNIQALPSRPEFGIGALVFSIATTVVMVIGGCWWGLPCSIVGIVLGMTSYEGGTRGNVEEAKKQCAFSVLCTTIGWITIIVGIAILVGVLVGIANSQDVPPDNY